MFFNPGSSKNPILSSFTENDINSTIETVLVPQNDCWSFLGSVTWKGWKHCYQPMVRAFNGQYARNFQVLLIGSQVLKLYHWIYQQECPAIQGLFIYKFAYINSKQIRQNDQICSRNILFSNLRFQYVWSKSKIVEHIYYE